MQQTDLDRILLIEVGGTHTRCAAARSNERPDRIALFDNSDHANLESIIAAYLDNLPGPSPRRAALAAAAVVDTRPIRVTNLGWTVDTERLQQRFGWSGTVVINDFEALACALPLLGKDELLTVHPGRPVDGAAIAVLGPGTGLGVSGIVPCRDRWYPIRGEGGHVTLAAHDDHEAKLLQRLRREYGHVSAERLLSGPGLVALYRLMAGDAPAGSPADVTRLADAGDTRALECLEQFFRFLATVAGDLALTLGARNGVYLGGGILPEIRTHLLGSGFRRRFIDKGRYRGYLDQVPVYLILAESPALRGIAAHPRVSQAFSSTGSRS